MALLNFDDEKSGNLGGLLSMALLTATGNKGLAKKMMLMQMLNEPSSEPSDGSFSGINPQYQPQTPQSLGSTSQKLMQGIAPAQLSQDKTAMLQQLKQSAQAAYPDNPMMQQVAITQAIHESGLMGRPSQLASKYNNYFGIKAPGTAGTVNMRTGEFLNGKNTTVNAGFGRNNSPSDSFMQHRNLMSKGRYQPVVNSQNPYDAFTALQRAGYATDPAYANKLNATYQRYVAPLY